MIETVPETGSTNVDLAWRIRAGEEIPEGFWLRAEKQTGGRGRLGREWVSPEGNLYCSTVVSIIDADPPAHSLSFVASLAVYDTLAQCLKPDRAILLKWPNDALVDRAKISGILLERCNETIVVGIGLNVSFSPDLPDRETTHIVADNDEFRGDVEEVLEILTRSFSERLSQWRDQGMSATLNAWRRFSHSSGDTLSATGADGEKVIGVFAGISEEGALQLRLPDGTHTEIYAGDVNIV